MTVKLLDVARRQGPLSGYEGEDSFYWEDKETKQCFRLVWDKANMQLVGMNSFGIRYRHRVFERWLAEKRDVSYVLSHLREANFDPEFFKIVEHDIIAAARKRLPQLTLQDPPRRKFLGLF